MFIKVKKGNPEFGGKKPLYFDPRGGTFVCDPQFRKQYLNFRLASFSSFWEIAQFVKQDIILDSIEPDVSNNLYFH